MLNWPQAARYWEQVLRVKPVEDEIIVDLDGMYVKFCVSLSCVMCMCMFVAISLQ